MSKNNLLRALRTGVWHISPSVGKTYLPLVTRLLKGEEVAPPEESDKRIQQYLFSTDRRKVPYQYDDDNDEISFDDEASGPNVTEGIHVLPLIGPIMKYDSWCEIGMQTRASQLLAADKLPQVTSHVLYIDSPGGVASAVEVMQRAIRAVEKPIVTVVDGMMCSAAYGIGSQTQKIYLSNHTDIIGSIGTMISLFDDSEYLKSMGFKVIDIYATDSTEKNKNYDDAIGGNTETMKAWLLDPLNTWFLESILEARPSLDEELVFKGRIFVGQEAIDAGLCDDYGTLDEVLENMVFNRFAGLKQFAKKGPLSKADREALNKEFAKYGIQAAAIEPHALLLTGGGENPRDIFVYANEGEDLVGKRCVYADDAGNATEEPLEDGDHPLSDGRTLTSETRDDGNTYVSAITAPAAVEPAAPAAPPAAPPAGSKVKGTPVKPAAPKVAAVAEPVTLEAIAAMMDEKITALRGEIGSNGDVPVARPKATYVGQTKKEDPMKSRKAEIAERAKQKYK